MATMENSQLIFKYGIVFADGTYYKGGTGSELKTHEPKLAYTFTETGAYAKIARMDHPGGNIWTTARVLQVLP